MRKYDQIEKQQESTDLDFAFLMAKRQSQKASIGIAAGNRIQSFLPKSHFIIKRFLFCAVILLFSQQSTTAQNFTPGDTIINSMEDVWREVSSNSNAVHLKELEVLMARENQKDAEAAKLPDIDVNGEYARLSNLPQYENGIFHSPIYYPFPNSSYSLGTSVYYNIYNGGHANSRVVSEKIGVVIGGHQRDLSLSEIKLLATAYYLDLLKYRAFESLLLQDISEQKKVLSQIKTIYQNGVVLKSDVLRAEFKLSKQQFQTIQVEDQIKLITQKINLLAGRPDNAYVNTIQPLLPDTLKLSSYEDWIAKGETNAYELKINADQLQLDKVKLRDSKANTMPAVDLFANYAYSYPQGQYYPYSLSLYGLGAIGIKANLPISALFKNKHRVSAAMLAVQETQTERLEVNDRIKNLIKENWLKFFEEQEHIKVADKDILQATENLRIIKNSYLNQTALITDYLDADVQLLQSQFELTEARTSALFRFYQLQNITGTL